MPALFRAACVAAAVVAVENRLAMSICVETVPGPEAVNPIAAEAGDGARTELRVVPLDWASCCIDWPGMGGATTAQDKTRKKGESKGDDGAIATWMS